MKLLLSEDWHTHLYAEPFQQRFRELGVEVHAFKEAPYFGWRETRPHVSRGSLSGRVQRRLGFGPAFARLNADLLATAKRIKPDAVFLFRGDAIFPETLRQLRGLGAEVVGWNNDDPFSDRAPARRWRLFVRGIPEYDRLWAYRHANVGEFEGHGGRRVGLLRSFYLKELNFPVAEPVEPELRSQVAFIGHWEDDGREDAVAALLRVPGLDFKLWGTLWHRSRIAGALEKRFGAIRPVLREAYNSAINGTGIALAFLSRLNRDTYTRRCFEIPITGTLMLCQYTADLATLFEEGVEAEFFRSTEEMLDKVRFYVRNDEARQKIGLAGRARVLRDGHEAMDRAKEVLKAIEGDRKG